MCIEDYSKEINDNWKKDKETENCSKPEELLELINNMQDAMKEAAEKTPKHRDVFRRSRSAKGRCGRALASNFCASCKEPSSHVSKLRPLSKECECRQSCAPQPPWQQRGHSSTVQDLPVASSRPSSRALHGGSLHGASCVRKTP